LENEISIISNQGFEDEKKPPNSSVLMLNACFNVKNGQKACTELFGVLTFTNLIPAYRTPK
jgi:hypothetical protein